MEQAEKVKHSRGKSRDHLVLAASDAHLTLRDLARLVGCSGPLITQARRGTRSISMELATKIQNATKTTLMPGGFEATKSNWPKLRQ